MTMVTRLLSRLLVVLCACGWYTNAYAQGAVQASIAGVVRDSSGAVLPGVTVEASSPVLIEKSRNAVSDDTGRYRIIALNPGTYTVTFTLPGFSTVKREAVELTGSLTATGMWIVDVDGTSVEATLSTPTPLTLTPSCATGVTAGIAKGTWDNGAHSITVTWTGCGTRTVVSE